MKKNKTIAWMLSIAMVLCICLSACGGGGSSTPAADQGGTGESAAPVENTGETYIIRMGCATVLPSHPNQFMEEFKEALESKSDQFQVELYPANQLGSNTQMIQGLQNGTVQAVILPVGFFTTIAPIMNILDMPALVPDSEMQYEMLNKTEVGDAFREEISKLGMTPLSYLYCVEKELLLDTPIETMDDLRGLKIRSFDSEVAQNEITAYGASPVSMSTNDLALALQQGAIDGLLNDVTMYDPMKLYEQAPYLIKAPSNPTSNCVMFSNQLLDQLPDDLRQILEETVEEVRESVYTYTHTYIQECYDHMVSEGCQIVEVSDEVKAQMNEAAAAATHESFLQTMPEAQPFYDMVVEYVEANTAAES